MFKLITTRKRLAKLEKPEKKSINQEKGSKP